jgi:two-component system phosphate regulon sensor histidine kinase PhoR
MTSPRWRVTSSRKIRLAPLWPALAAVLVMTGLLVWLVPPLFHRATAHQLLDGLRLVHHALEPALAGPQRQLQDRASDLATGTNLRITVIALDGRVLADSDRTWTELGRMENHAARPEVRAALAGGSGTATRRSDTTGRHYVYAARPFPGTRDGGYVLRLAQPLDELTMARRSLAQAVAAALLATLATIAVLSAWLDRRLLGPLADLISDASALATGRTDQRLPVPEHEDLAELAAAVNRMRDHTEAQMTALAAERDHLQAILASMSEGVLVVDGGGRAVLANPAFRRLFAVAGEVAGRLPYEVARHPQVAEVIAETLARGEARREEVSLEGGPAPRTLALAGSALHPASRRQEGRPGAVLVARDTTELTRLTRVRSEFVANVSHELKTPLSAIRGYAETLGDGALDEPPTARRFVDRILEQCRRLQALLDDLLTLSRLESPDVPVERRPVDLRRVVERSLETAAGRARERGVELAAELPDPDRPIAFEGDANNLERLLLNLLDNAIKYNRPGGDVTVRLEAEEGEDGPEVVLSVTDTGLGIPASALPRIFERFYRVDKGRARDEGGTGLGLAIVKHVAQSHGGRVEVESAPGVGSTFRVHLPAAAAAERAAG